MRKLMRSRILLGVLVGVMGLVADNEPFEWVNGNFVSQAEAIVGRPATARSIAGVARRTTRRVIRRTNVYIQTLPAGCSTVIVDNVTVYSCGGVYYQPYQNQYVVVVID
jgi:hypothetical protein